MNNKSKPLAKNDDACKQFIIESLKGDETHGFDIDSIYFNKGKWYIFEYLKCESKTATPHTSDPKYYARNWKKFYYLYSVTKQLNGKLFLVNYSTREKDENEVRIMEVIGFDLEKAQAYSGEKIYEYMKLNSKEITKERFSDELRKFNRGQDTSIF